MGKLLAQRVRGLLRIAGKDFVKARATEVTEAAKKKKAAKWRPQQEGAKLKRAANKNLSKADRSKREQGGGNNDRSAN